MLSFLMHREGTTFLSCDNSINKYRNIFIYQGGEDKFETENMAQVLQILWISDFSPLQV